MLLGAPPAGSEPTPLGAPGIRFVPPEPVRELTGVRRDVVAFAGIAPRGAARLPDPTLEPDVDVATWLAVEPVRRSVPVRVTSWDEYRQRFGGFEGPGRLPYAVSAFFAAGGQVAEVIRIVHDHGDPVADAGGCASGTPVSGPAPAMLQLTADGVPVFLRARTEGSWGDRLSVRVSFPPRPLAFASATTTELVVDRRAWVPGGSLLRLTLPGGVQELRFVDRSYERDLASGPGRERVLDLAVAAAAVPLSAELVTATVDVADRDPAWPRQERLADVGLRADHPRWLARALVLESDLVWPEPAWAAGALDLTDAALPPYELAAMAGGADRWADVVPEDFWDPAWVPGDDEPGDGVHCLVGHGDIGVLVAPDLYDPRPIPARDDVTDPPTLCGPDFEVHLDLGPPSVPTAIPPGLAGLALDPTIPGDLARIVANQSALVELAEVLRDLTVLLDVPPGLAHHQVLRWRANFDSAFAAAYHPWLDVAAPDDDRDSLVRINPSAFAAGIVADRELRLGVQFGPANQLAVGAVRVAEELTDAQHDELHPEGVNVFRPERDGIRLTAARTLSRRLPLRQLSVARLMTVLRLTFEREMRWAVFEPNSDELWAEIRRTAHGLLTRLFEAGAFAGATTKEAFFVRCDRTTMTGADLDQGRMICLVGVAPAEPVEHIVLQIALEADRGVTVSVAG
jgi:uncharacterized protein